MLVDGPNSLPGGKSFGEMILTLEGRLSYIARPAFRGPDLEGGKKGTDQKMNPSAFRISLPNLDASPLGFAVTKIPSLFDF